MSKELAVLQQVKNGQSKIGEIKQFLSQDDFITIDNQTWMRNGNYTTSSDPMAHTIDIGSLRLPTAITNTNAAINCSIKVGSLITASTQAGTILQSNTNGESWTVSGSGKPILREIAYGNGIYVGITSNTATLTIIYTSTDGLTWTARTEAGAVAHESIAFGNGCFVVGINSGSTSCIATSTDGITWTTKSVSGTYCRKVRFIQELGVFVLVAGSSNAYTLVDNLSNPVAGNSVILARGNTTNYMDDFVWFNNKCYFITGTPTVGIEVYESYDGLTFVKKAVGANGYNFNVKGAKVINGLLCILTSSATKPYFYTTNMIDFYTNDTYPETTVNSMSIELADNGNVVMIGNSGGTTSRITIGTQITGFGLHNLNDNSYVRVS